VLALSCEPAPALPCLLYLSVDLYHPSSLEEPSRRPHSGASPIERSVSVTVGFFFVLFFFFFFFFYRSSVSRPLIAPLQALVPTGMIPFNCNPFYLSHICFISPPFLPHRMFGFHSFLLLEPSVPSYLPPRRLPCLAFSLCSLRPFVLSPSRVPPFKPLDENLPPCAGFFSLY